MKGYIYHTNKSRGMFSVKLENNSFVVFELLDYNDMNQNDIVSGIFDCEGSTRIFNYNTNESSDVIIQSIDCIETVAHKRTNL